ncbi:hypothetical protein TNCV_4024311 [Trichonephila clavipes]|uniref:Uncharacterized protein n=1 Tax=Trichonephila clavipes TaxID=2585209 RepID=A0A8X7BJK8_TRICX|nr:hypothetical protein TNCV_4024311 [Trichonephila clavipes]
MNILLFSGPSEFSNGTDSPQNIFILQNIDDWMRMPKPYPTAFGKLVIGDSSSASMCVMFGKAALLLYYQRERDGATAHKGQGLLCPSQYMRPCAQRCMNRCSGLSEANPSV